MRTQLTTLSLAAILATPAQASEPTTAQHRQQAQAVADAITTGTQLPAANAATSRALPAPSEPRRRSRTSGATGVGTMLVRFENHTDQVVHAQVYSQDRPGHTWPTPERVWSVGAGGIQQVISCQIGEVVCYGAWQAADTDTSWGAGSDGERPSADCCVRCGGGSIRVGLTD
ncbi:MAG: hypothetical protein ABIO70_12080 [Pseudomonadota bacterium]